MLAVMNLQRPRRKLQVYDLGNLFRRPTSDHFDLVAPLKAPEARDGSLQTRTSVYARWCLPCHKMYFTGRKHKTVSVTVSRGIPTLHRCGSTGIPRWHWAHRGTRLQQQEKMRFSETDCVKTGLWSEPNRIPKHLVKFQFPHEWQM